MKDYASYINRNTGFLFSSLGRVSIQHPVLLMGLKHYAYFTSSIVHMSCAAMFSLPSYLSEESCRCLKNLRHPLCCFSHGNPYSTSCTVLPSLDVSRDKCLRAQFWWKVMMATSCNNASGSTTKTHAHTGLHRTT